MIFHTHTHERALCGQRLQQVSDTKLRFSTRIRVVEQTIDSRQRAAEQAEGLLREAARVKKGGASTQRTNHDRIGPSFCVLCVRVCVEYVWLVREICACSDSCCFGTSVVAVVVVFAAKTDGFNGRRRWQQLRETVHEIQIIRKYQETTNL